MAHLLRMFDALNLRLSATLASFRQMSRRRKAALVAAVLAVTGTAPALAIGFSGAASGLSVRQPLAQILDLSAEPKEPPAMMLVWEGRDLDGDGAADVVNPTGAAPRPFDAYGSGEFGASRDGGTRRHAGMDFVANAGQAVVAPISGFVTRIGQPYANDTKLKYVEISNPALRISARVFYVDPQVVIGDAVRLGSPIGVAQTLQARYPDGITDHVHLEMANGTGHRIDPNRMLQARLEAASTAAG